MTASWDSMRKEARRLETDIDAKLVEYSKLAAQIQSLPARASFDAARPTTEDEALQRRNTASRDTATAADNMTVDMESLLSRLSSVVEAMREACVTAPALQHTMQRHAEILHDYSQEFRKTKETLAVSREHSELLAGAKIPGEVSRTGGNGMEGIYKERAAISAASSGADTVVQTGLSLKEDLERQRAMFASMVERMETMSEGLPAVNRLIGQIRRKKKRDVLIMAAVVSTLLFITFSWKVMH